MKAARSTLELLYTTLEQDSHITATTPYKIEIAHAIECIHPPYSIQKINRVRHILQQLIHLSPACGTSGIGIFAPSRPCSPASSYGKKMLEEETKAAGIASIGVFGTQKDLTTKLDLSPQAAASDDTPESHSPRSA